MKKQAAAVFLLGSMASALFAFTLPTGQEVDVQKWDEENGKIVAVIPKSSVTVSTKYGTFKTKPRKEIRFYESGALRSFYTSTPQPVVLTTVKPKDGDGKKKLSRLLSPHTASFTLKSVDKDENLMYPDLPIELHENGTLKSGILADTKSMIPATETDRFNVDKPSQITFYDDEQVQSLFLGEIVSSPEHMDTKTLSPYFHRLFTQLGSVYRLKGVSGKYRAAGGDTYSASMTAARFYFLPKSKLEFYHSGAVKEFTPWTAIPVEVLGSSLVHVKEKTGIRLSEMGELLSYIPADGSKVEMQDKVTFLLQNGERRENHPDGKLKTVTFETTRKDFSYGGIQFTGNNATETIQGTGVLQGKSQAITFEHAPSGAVVSATILDKKGMERSFIANVGGEFVSATRIERTESGAWKSVSLYPALTLQKDGDTNYVLTKLCFAPDGKTVAAYFGAEKSLGGLLLIPAADEAESPRVIYDDAIVSESEVLFDDAGVVTAYTAKSGGTTGADSELAVRQLNENTKDEGDKQ